MATNNNDQWAQRSGIWLPDSTTRALEKASRPPVSAYALRQSDLTGRSVSSPSPRRDARRAKNLQQQLTDSYNKGVFYTSQATSTSYGLPGRGMEKPAGVAFAALRAVSKTSLIDAAIITALKDQARRYAQICDVPGKQRGFRVVHRKWQDPHFDSDTPDIRSRCAEMEELITRPTSPPHASFEDFLVNAIHEQLVIDRRCVVLTKDRAGRIGGYHLVAGETVKPVVEQLAPWMTDEQGRHQYTSEQALYRMQADLWRNPPADPLSGRTVHIDLTDAAYVQVVEGRVVSAWKSDEMMIAIANSTVELNHAFYGISPLESSIYLSILFSKAMRYNFNLFDVSFPEGILAITGDFDEEGLEAFKRAAFEFDESEASSRLPIITGDRDVEAKIISLRDTPRDMLFTEMMRWLANLKCAFYRIHPSLINVPEEGSAIQIGGATDAAVEQSVGDGFHGLMMSQANLLRRALVEPRYPDLIVIIEGLDHENEQLAIERLQVNKTIQTINEVRISQGLEPLPDELPTAPGDFVADSGYLQVYNLLAQQAQQSQQQDMGQYEAGDFGQGGDETQQDQSGGDDSGDDVQQGWQRGAQSSQSAAPQGGPGQGAPGASAQQFQQAQQGGSGLFGKSRSLAEESGEVTVRVRLPRGKSLEDVLRGGDPTVTERDDDRGW